MDKNEVISIVSKYKLLVSKHFDMENMILFGSYAKGNQKDDSDIDVAIVVNSITQDFFHMLRYYGNYEERSMTELNLY